MVRLFNRSESTPPQGLENIIAALPNAGASPTIRGEFVIERRSHPWAIIIGMKPVALAKLLAHSQRYAGI